MANTNKNIVARSHTYNTEKVSRERKGREADSRVGSGGGGAKE